MDVIVYVLIYKKRNTNRRKQNRDERLPMAGMKRFIAYIYGYENAKKAGNTGFARIELRGEECRLEIHLRSVYAAQTHCRFICFANRVIRWREA